LFYLPDDKLRQQTHLLERQACTLSNELKVAARAQERFGCTAYLGDRCR
jgi:hypothetical protein